MEPRQHDQLAPIVRSARISDAKRMAEVYVGAWRDAYPILLPARTLAHMSVDRWTQQFSSSITRGREIVLVAEDHRQGVIGLATGGPALDRGVIANARGACEIFSLYVSADFGGRGAGSGLLRNMLYQFVDRGAPAAFAWMLRGNPSRFFYEHMGAKLVAEKAERRFGEVIRLEAYAWPDLHELRFRRRLH
jgi:L-amino acid N-acyltransferase YncA